MSRRSLNEVLILVSTFDALARRNLFDTVDVIRLCAIG
jgi:hypothetical protein